MKHSSKKIRSGPLAGWGSGKLERLAGLLSTGRIERDARALHSTDRNYCYSEMSGTADHAASLLRGAGLGVTVTPLRADGATTYLDYTMPQAWDVEDGRLEVVSPGNCADPVLADCRMDRFVVPNRCTATPPGGITAPLVHYDDRDSMGVRGKWVLIKIPAQTVKADMIARGAAGLVSFFSESGDTMQDTVFWHNGWSQGTGWYHSKPEPRIVMFSISCRRGKMLEALLKKGRRVVLKGFVKSRTYDGVIKTVSGLIPGKKKQEIVVLGHMYEPLADDNAAGNAAMIEMCRVINQQVRAGALPKPCYSIRILLSMERYGMGQFFASPARSRNVLAAICVDSIAMDQARTGTLDILTTGPMAFPFFGDFVLEDLIARYNTHPFKQERGAFGDDTFMADPMIGVPIAWYWCHEGRYHHNTNNTFDVLDWSNCLEKSGIILRYIAALAWLDPEAARRRVPTVVTAVEKKLGLAFDELCTHSRRRDRVSLDRHIRFYAEVARRHVASLARFGVKPAVLREAGAQIERYVATWNAKLGCVRTAPARIVIDQLERRAGNMIPKRLTRGLPFDNAKIPFPERRRFACETERFVAWIDGRRNLWEVIQYFAIDRGLPVRPDEAKLLIEYTQYLARYGYLKLAQRTTAGTIELKRGLRGLGIRKGERG